jgi:hypothetical protein
VYESHLALNENEQARAMLDQAEAISRALKGSARQFDMKIAAHLEQRVKSLRTQLGTKKPR